MNRDTILKEGWGVSHTSPRFIGGMHVVEQRHTEEGRVVARQALVSADIAFDSMKGIEGMDNLNELIQEAAKHPMTPDERRANRISLAMGMLPSNSTITREDMEEIYDDRRY